MLFKQRHETYRRKSDQQSINLCCWTNCRLILELEKVSAREWAIQRQRLEGCPTIQRFLSVRHSFLHLPLRLIVKFVFGRGLRIVPDEVQLKSARLRYKIM